MSATYYPATLDFPVGWPVGNSIGPITIPYSGPALTDADIFFRLGALELTNADGEISVAAYSGPDLPRPDGAVDSNGDPILYTPTEQITIHTFAPPLAGEIPYRLYVEWPLAALDELKFRDLFAGTFHVCTVEPGLP